MRWIDRGTEPPTVAGYDRQFTPGWVEHYRQNRGQAPTDSFWREYRASLGERSGDECWYCGRQCNASVGDKVPTVDHFRPRSKFPELTYQWSNWVFSCQRCNESKGDRWPETGLGNDTGYGYVDPGAADPAERPEQCFDYDARNGLIEPRENLSERDNRKATDTIRDLRLNDYDLRFDRWDAAQEVEAALLAGLSSLPAAEHSAYIALFVETEAPDEFTWVTRIIVERARREERV